MVINNHRRIDTLEEQIGLEQARVRFLEDFSDRLGEKVGKLENSMKTVKKEVAAQKRSLMTILNIIKLISDHRAETRRNGKLFEIMRHGTVSVIQNALVFGIVQIVMKITWLDSLIDGITELLRLGIGLGIGNTLSKKSVERSRFLVKLSFSLTLFLILRERIKKILMKLKDTINFLV
jgi:hypothetical protein